MKAAKIGINLVYTMTEMTRFWSEFCCNLRSFTRIQWKKRGILRAHQEVGQMASEKEKGFVFKIGPNQRGGYNGPPPRSSSGNQQQSCSADAKAKQPQGTDKSK